MKKLALALLALFLLLPPALHAGAPVLSPTPITQGMINGGDFHIGDTAYKSRIVISGDSRCYGLGYNGAYNTPYSASLTPPSTYLGQPLEVVNKCWPSLTIQRMLYDPVYQIDMAGLTNPGLSYNAFLNMEILGPIGINDLVNGRSIAQIEADIEAYCKFKRNILGVKMILISEISAGTSYGGVTGDDLKNGQQSWLLTTDTSGANSGNPHWMSFVDAVVLPGNFPPEGQNCGGTYGTSGTGCKNSTYYEQDLVHEKNAGNVNLGTRTTYGVNDVMNGLISTLAAANYYSPRPPSLLGLVQRVYNLEHP